MFRNILLACSVAFLSLTNTAYEGCADTCAAFLIPASIVYYVMNTRTIDGVRNQAKKTVYDYEHHHGIFTVEEVRYAYEIAEATDEQLSNKIWWQNLCSSTIVGLLTSMLYLDIVKYPSKHRHSGIYTHLHFGNSSYAAPRYR